MRRLLRCWLPVALVAAPCLLAAEEEAPLPFDVALAVSPGDAAPPEGIGAWVTVGAGSEPFPVPGEAAFRMVEITGAIPVSPEDAGRSGPGLRAFEDFASALAARNAGRVRGYVLSVRPEEGEGALDLQVFLLKKGATALRGGDPRVEVLAGIGAMPPAALLPGDMDVYLSGAVVGSPLVPQDLRAAFPRGEFWGSLPSGTPQERALALALEAMANGLEGWVFPGDVRLKEVEEAARCIGSIPPGFVPSPGASRPRFRTSLDGPEIAYAVAVLVEPKTLRNLVVYSPPRQVILPEEGGAVLLELSSGAAEEIQARDPWSGETWSIGNVLRDPRRGTTTFMAPARRSGVLVGYRVAETEEALAEGRTAEVEVREKRGMRVEQVLAFHQVFQAAQEARVHTYIASCSAEMNFTSPDAGQGGVLQVRSRYYHLRDGHPEWENLEYFVNGAPYRNEVPNLPLVQPDKVHVLPLQIRLDEAYTYTLEGEDTVEGRPAYRVGFRPSSPAPGLPAGAVWIDKQNFARLRLRSVRSGMEPPVLAVDQTETYVPVDTPEGTVWLLGKSEVHESFTLLGYSITADIRTDYTDFRVNPEDFEGVRARAFASTNKILRDTDAGLRYLVPDGEGGRKVQEEIPRKTRFWLAGAFFDDSLDYPIPLGGVNFLNFDARGKGIQTNYFLAGVLGTASVSDPRWLGSRFEGAASAFYMAVARADRELGATGGEIEENRIRYREASATLSLARQLGSHFRLRGELELEYLDYTGDDSTRDDFRIPADHVEAVLGLRAEWRVRGWNCTLRGEYGWRSRWEEWGVPGSPEAEEDGKDYVRWGADLSKDWLHGKFQKTGFTLRWMDGSGLDRFSRYQLSFFGDRIRGFSGSGIRFDEGVILQLRHGWSVANLVGVSAHVDAGYLQDRGFGGESSKQAGIGITGDIPGPKGTVVRFDLGYGLWSSAYEEAEGKIEAELVFLKVF